MELANGLDEAWEGKGIVKETLRILAKATGRTKLPFPKMGKTGRGASLGEKSGVCFREGKVSDTN